MLWCLVIGWLDAKQITLRLAQQVIDAAMSRFLITHPSNAETLRHAVQAHAGVVATDIPNPTLRRIHLEAPHGEPAAAARWPLQPGAATLSTTVNTAPLCPSRLLAAWMSPP